MWRAASDVKKQKLIEDEKSSSSTLSSAAKVDYGFRQLPSSDVCHARLSQVVNLTGSELFATVSLPAVNVCDQCTDSSPAAALIKQEVSTFLAAVAPKLMSGDLLTDDVVATPCSWKHLVQSHRDTSSTQESWLAINP